jgi:hypothetical protein
VERRDLTTLGAERYSGERGKKQFFDLSEANSLFAMGAFTESARLEAEIRKNMQRLGFEVKI